MKLGIDIDNTVARFAELADRQMRAYAAVNGITLAGADFTKWDWYREYQDGRRWWNRFWEECRTHKLLRFVDPIPGAREALHHLRLNGHDITFITARKDTYADDTQVWVHNVLGMFPVVHSRDKTVIDADIWVDDSPGQIRHLSEAGKTAVVYKQPWNRDLWLSHPSVASWGEFVEALGGWTC